ncbi:hypothetical protein EPO33_04800 [Patescibacteria group bacterium]|nr:MAG: hypothetical protein EPO33_04800 [Patescibacteria group bacterium]
MVHLLVSELKSVESQVEELNRQANVLRKRARELRVQVVPLTVCGWIVVFFKGEAPEIQPASAEAVSSIGRVYRVRFRVDASDGHLVYGVTHPEGCLPFKLPDGGYDNRSDSRLIGYFHERKAAELFTRIDPVNLPRVSWMSVQCGVWTPAGARLVQAEWGDDRTWEDMLETP